MSRTRTTYLVDFNDDCPIWILEIHRMSSFESFHVLSDRLDHLQSIELVRISGIDHHAELMLALR